jgi:hypothetical protein
VEEIQDASGLENEALAVSHRRQLWQVVTSQSPYTDLRLCMNTAEQVMEQGVECQSHKGTWRSELYAAETVYEMLESFCPTGFLCLTLRGLAGTHPPG